MIKSLMKQKFDPNKTFEYYKKHCAGKYRDSKLIDKLMRSLLPYIDIQINMRIQNNECEDDVLSAALEKILKIVYTKSAPVKNVWAFLKYIGRAVYFAGVDAIYFNYKEDFDYTYGCEPLPRAELPTPMDMEYKIFLEQFIRELWYDTVDRLRFDGTHRKICLEIMQSYFVGSFNGESWLARKYNVPLGDVKFLQSYILILLKDYFYLSEDTPSFFFPAGRLFEQRSKYIL